MVVKTREKLIDVARQLFAYKGVENTTMNDIATASETGRRTIYTYFKNKREIYNAVIEQESELLVSRLREVTLITGLSPTEKLFRFIDKRIDIIVENVEPRDKSSIRSFFIKGIRRMERIRATAAAKEREIINEIMCEGFKTGEFDPNKSQGAYQILAIIFQGIELSYIRDNFEDLHVTQAQLKDYIKRYILSALIK